MKLAGEKFDPSVYFPAVAGYYTSPKGEIVSLPFNSSTMVFYYNKDMFARRFRLRTVRRQAANAFSDCGPSI